MTQQIRTINRVKRIKTSDDLLYSVSQLLEDRDRSSRNFLHDIAIRFYFILFHFFFSGKALRHVDQSLRQNKSLSKHWIRVNISSKTFLQYY